MPGVCAPTTCSCFGVTVRGAQQCLFMSRFLVEFPTRVLWNRAVACLFVPAWIGCAGKEQRFDEGLWYGQPAGSVQDYPRQGGNAGEIDRYDTIPYESEVHGKKKLEHDDQREYM